MASDTLRRTASAPAASRTLAQELPITVAPGLPHIPLHCVIIDKCYALLFIVARAATDDDDGDDEVVRRGPYRSSADRAAQVEHVLRLLLRQPPITVKQVHALTSIPEATIYGWRGKYLERSSPGADTWVRRVTI